MLDLYIKAAIAILLIISVAKIIGACMPLIKQPKVIGEMIAGVILGPTIFGKFFPEISLFIFSAEIKPILFVISNFGLSIYMFLVGMEIDTKNINKNVIHSTIILSIVAVLFPFLSTIPVVYAFYDQLIGNNNINHFQLIIFLGTSLAITAFPMLARILEEKQIIKTKLGELMLLSASIQDVLSWILLSFVISIAKYQQIEFGFYTIIGCVLFILFVKIFIKIILNKISNNTKKDGQLSHNSFSIIIIILIASSIITDKIGLYSVFGGFIIGLYMPRNKTLVDSIKIRLNDIMLTFFLPIFFAYSGLNTNFNQILSSNIIYPCLAILFCGFFFKFIPIIFAMIALGYSKREAIATGGLMNSRGLMELIIANIGINYNIINLETYSILVLLAILSTLAALPIYELSNKK